MLTRCTSYLCMYKFISAEPKLPFYVYSLLNPITNKPFYVGKGSNDRYKEHFRECFKKKRSHKLSTIKNIVNQNLDVLIQINIETIDEKFALQKEVELIRFWGRRDIRTGILTNLTDGGEGVSGFISTRDISGENNPMFGKTHTPEARQNISRKNKERIEKFGARKHSEEHKQKLRDNNAGGVATSKEIYQIDTLGNIVAKYKSSRSAGKSTGINFSNINACANYKGESVCVGGFYWRFIDDPNIVDSKLVNFEELNKLRTRTKSIQQIDSERNVLNTWSSLKEASKETGFPISNISTAVNHNKKYNGFYWSFV